MWNQKTSIHTLLEMLKKDLIHWMCHEKLNEVQRQLLIERKQKMIEQVKGELGGRIMEKLVAPAT